jgi:hypothetical protein
MAGIEPLILAQQSRAALRFAISFSVLPPSIE